MLEENPNDVPTITEVTTEEEFKNVLKLYRAIVYILVTWSGPERISRSAVFKALGEIKIVGTPVFKIDCSRETNYVEQWLVEQGYGQQDLCYGGWGETLLLENGKLIDFIKNPAGLGYESIKHKLAGWEKRL